jgi:hypothetical protein
MTIFGAPLELDDDPRSPEAALRIRTVLNDLTARAEASLRSVPAAAPQGEAAGK